MKTFNKKTIDDINFKGKKVLLRLDLNVPMKDGKICDENRIVTALPTINKIIKDGGRLIICSHFGKPKGEVKPELSLQPVAKRFSELLDKDVTFIDSPKVVDNCVKEYVNTMEDGEICVLQNTRFRKEEEANDPEFAKDLASICDIYVDDAFGTTHRAHASNVGVTKYVPTTAIGYLMQKEVDYLGNAVNNPKRPFVCILGGAKVSDKLKVIDNLLTKADTLIIGGGMAYTFLKAQGYEVGKSLCDDEKLEYCKKMLDKAKALGKTILLPVDSVCAKEFPNPIDKHIPSKTYDVGQFPKDVMGLDIGEKTIKIFMKALQNAKTVVWNGPMGIFENPDFALGTYCVARTLSQLKDATTIIGGGDSASAVNNFKLGDKMSHISTGGGASLEFLEGKEMPGIEAIKNK